MNRTPHPSIDARTRQVPESHLKTAEAVHEGIAAKQKGTRIQGMLLGDIGFGKEAKHPPLPFLQVDMFPWANLDPVFSTEVGCGPAMLGQITGTNPYEIRDWLKKRAIAAGNKDDALCGGIHVHTSAEEMSAYLALHGISMIPIGVNDIYSMSHVLLTDRHAILAAQYLSPVMRSWLAYYNNTYYHNGEQKPATAIGILSAPVTDLFILFKQDWKFRMKGRLDWQTVESPDSAV